MNASAAPPLEDELELLDEEFELLLLELDELLDELELGTTTTPEEELLELEDELGFGLVSPEELLEELLELEEELLDELLELEEELGFSIPGIPGIGTGSAPPSVQPCKIKRKNAKTRVRDEIFKVVSSIAIQACYFFNIFSRHAKFILFVTLHSRGRSRSSAMNQCPYKCDRICIL